VARRAFARKRDGSLQVTLYPQEVELLAMTARNMATLVEQPPDGAVRDRLYPRAYLDPTEESAQQEFDAHVHEDLAAGRKRALETIVADLESAKGNAGGDVVVAVTRADESQWLTGLNDLRLIVGTLIGVTEEDESQREADADDPHFEGNVLYGWLTELQADLVDLLLDDIGEAGTDT
jgi:hypothetical protein